MTTTEHELAVPPGLRGVKVTDTSVGDVRGEEGFFHYRQYSATELAARRSFEDVWRLLLEGALPDSATEAKAFAADAASRRRLPDDLLEILPAVAVAGRRAGPLDSLRTALSLYGAAKGMRPLWDIDAAQRNQDLMDLAAITPVVAAALHRLGQGLQPIPPDPSRGHAADYLRMITGAEPEPRLARALEKYLILTIDHGFNSSTFTSRVIASTGADAAAAVVGALGALSGPLHGGAPSRALDLLDGIGTLDNAGPYVGGLLERGERIMGFGHAVYRTEDPRSAMLRDVAVGLGGARADLAVAVEQIVLDALRRYRPQRPLYANVEYYAGVVMERCGIPPEMFTSTFAVSRVVGWCANISEQAEERTIIRPAARYTGPQAPVEVPPPPG